MLSESLRRVCELQPTYSSANTPEMQERGRLIRQTIPDELRALDGPLRQSLAAFGGDFLVEGKDGIGRKTEAPWVRFSSKRLSPSARDGYYVVIHFAADGSAVFITIGCGSTTWNEGTLKTASDDDLAERTEWARRIIASRFGSLTPFDDRIALGARAALPRAFEQATVMAKRIAVESLDEDFIQELLVQAAQRLAAVYEMQDAGGPETQADQIRAYVRETYLEPARQRGERRASVRAGDVQRGMGLSEAWTNICNALRGAKLAQQAGVRVIGRTDPDDSTTTTYQFDLYPDERGSSAETRPTMTEPTNLILYGPPGTGKTYASAAEAVRLCDGLAPDHPLLAPSGRTELMARFAQLREDKRIEFVTFHQSYGYEDFVEGLRPVQDLSADGEARAGFTLQAQPGVFKIICRRAETSKGEVSVALDPRQRRVFKMSIGEASNSADDYLFEEALETGRLLLGWGDKVDWSQPQFTTREAMIEAWAPHNPPDRKLSASSGYIKYPFTLRNRVRNGDLVVVTKGNALFRAIGEVTGPYEYSPREEDGYPNQRPVRWLWVDRRGVPSEEIYASAFIQGSIYELNTEEINYAALSRYLSTAAQPSGPPEPFVIVIDEINRANISKVFGELITLIEPGKRLGSAARPNPEAITVQLPFSRERFGVPANVHIVGTMNTADRSIALLDTALRRRFRFRELMPKPELLSENLAGVNLRRMLERLNERIEHLFDRDHQIGHAYFLKASTRAQLDDVMRFEVIPLLAEYFHEDWDRIWLALDEPSGEENGNFLHRRPLSLGGDGGQVEADDRYRYAVKPVFSDDAYARLGR